MLGTEGVLTMAGTGELSISHEVDVCRVTAENILGALKTQLHSQMQTT